MKDRQYLNSLALQTRKLWNEDGYSPIDIFSYVNGWKDKKITIIKYPMTSKISGMCTREAEDIVICINSATSYGRQRFTLAHELYHILYEKELSQVICETMMSDEKSDSEKEADQFASYLLMPYDALFQYAANVDEWTIEKVIDAEQFFQVSHQAMLYRLRSEDFISDNTYEQFKSVSVSSVAARMGYGTELYTPTSKEKQYFTTGEYIRKVEMMSESDYISQGKRDEFLMDAYRADIVYNYDGEEEKLND